MTWHLFFGDLNQSGKNSEIKPPLARGQKEEGQTLSQDVDCLMGSYMPPCPPWTDQYYCFHFFLYVPSAKTSESNLSDKQEGSNYVFQFIFCSFTIMDIPYMLKYLCMIRYHPYITAAYFWTFLIHPLCQHKYCTECQQKWPFSDPTHRVLLLT